MQTLKIGVIVGGKANPAHVMKLHSIFTNAQVKVKAVDLTGGDIIQILKNTKDLDYLFLDRESTVETRVRLVRALRHLQCNLVLFKSAKNVSGTKFYSMYTKCQENHVHLNELLLEKCNTELRHVCTHKKDKLKYKLYLAQQWVLDKYRALTNGLLKI